jgi:hypothetical protein
MNEDAGSQFLVDVFPPDGRHGPRCGTAEPPSLPRSVREPILDSRCRRCHRAFNAWTGTAFPGTHWRPSQIVLILRGFAQGTPTARLARELACSRRHLLDWRPRLQAQAQAALDRTPLEDPVVEADEMDPNAGEKGMPHPDPEDPPRRRANKVRGHGTMAKDRPPVIGVVGRRSGEVRLEVAEHSDPGTLEIFVGAMTRPGPLVNTDEWSGYDRLPK